MILKAPSGAGGKSERERIAMATAGLSISGGKPRRRGGIPSSSNPPIRAGNAMQARLSPQKGNILMCSRPDIRAFLGAPRPADVGAWKRPSRPADPGAEEARPPRWRRLELTWRGGRLVPVAANRTQAPLGFSTPPHRASEEPPSLPGCRPEVSAEPEAARPEAWVEPGAWAERTGARPTLLARCTQGARSYGVLAAAVHPCQVKEIQVRRGPRAGSRVPLASLLVTDQSGVDATVLLWRRSAYRAVSVGAGDVLFLTGLRPSEDVWTGEKVLQSTFASKLLHLGHVSAPAFPRDSGRVDAASVAALCRFLGERRPSLLASPARPPRDPAGPPYAPRWARAVNSLVHALLRVKDAYVSTEWRAEAESWRRSALERHAVASAVGAGGQRGALVLRGSALDWLPRFRRRPDAVWDVRFLLVREGRDWPVPELHATYWSAARPLDPADPRLAPFLRDAAGGAVEMDVDTLLSQEYSGEVALKVRVLTFGFRSSRRTARPGLDVRTSLSEVAAALSDDTTYPGCGRCAAELECDANGIYRPCYPCLPAGLVRRYYRPAALTIGRRDGRRVRVEVPGVGVEKILGVAPEQLQKDSGAGVRAATERLRLVLSGESAVSVRSHFVCDENGAPVSRELTLLDLQLAAQA
ncbi:shieldin complex subunit 2 [Stigmatopora nigra]